MSKKRYLYGTGAYITKCGSFSFKNTRRDNPLPVPEQAAEALLRDYGPDSVAKTIFEVTEEQKEAEAAAKAARIKADIEERDAATKAAEEAEVKAQEESKAAAEAKEKEAAAEKAKDLEVKEEDSPPPVKEKEEETPEKIVEEIPWDSKTYNQKKSFARSNGFDGKPNYTQPILDAWHAAWSVNQK